MSVPKIGAHVLCPNTNGVFNAATLVGFEPTTKQFLVAYPGSCRETRVALSDVVVDEEPRGYELLPDTHILVCDDSGENFYPGIIEPHDLVVTSSTSAVRGRYTNARPADNDRFTAEPSNIRVFPNEFATLQYYLNEWKDASRSVPLQVGDSVLARREADLFVRCTLVDDEGDGHYTVEWEGMYQQYTKLPRSHIISDVEPNVEEVKAGCRILIQQMSNRSAFREATVLRSAVKGQSLLLEFTHTSSPTGRGEKKTDVIGVSRIRLLKSEN